MLGQQPVRKLKRVKPGQAVNIYHPTVPHELKFDATTADQYNQQAERLENDRDPEPNSRELHMWCETHMRREWVMLLVLVQLVEAQLEEDNSN